MVSVHVSSYGCMQIAKHERSISVYAQVVEMPAANNIPSQGSCHSDDNREFKKLRRQLQGKRHIKIELCVKLSLLRLFHVDHVVQNRRSALSLV